ncbi:MAG TPA: hypothetical protein VH481_10535 [Nitrososphaeraceae archaeon]
MDINVLNSKKLDKLGLSVVVLGILMVMLTGLTSSGQLSAQMMPNNMTGMGSGQMGGMGSGQMGGMGGMDMGQMPPHYSKSTYHLMSSVKGIEISGLEIVNDKGLSVKITNNSTNPVNQNLTLVGGGGDLAGSATVKGGWESNTKVNLTLRGIGSLFNLEGIHLHLFP